MYKSFISYHNSYCLDCCTRRCCMCCAYSWWTAACTRKPSSAWLARRWRRLHWRQQWHQTLDPRHSRQPPAPWGPPTATTSSDRWTPLWSGHVVSGAGWRTTTRRCTIRRSRSDSVPTGSDWARRRSDRSSTRRSDCARCTWPNTPTTSTGLDDVPSQSKRRPWNRQPPRPGWWRPTTTKLAFHSDISPAPACTCLRQ